MALDKGETALAEVARRKADQVNSESLGMSNNRYCAFHVQVQTNFRGYYFYFLPDQSQILLDHFNV